MATTEQLMAQYGVAWFDFDELSGNVYDKLGLNNYVGTVTGATRTQGWDGLGNAINFNGANQYIQFNQNLIQNGAKTIKFKIKVNSSSNVQYIFSNYATTAPNQGWYITIDNTGRLDFTFYNGTTNIFAMKSNSIVTDNKWHDIVFTWSNIIGGKAYLFVNSTQDSVMNISSLETSYSVSTMIGKPSTVSNYYLNGQLDDLQIYNKALSPSDFTQKRLAIKSADNKNLVLYPTKIKEIPNVVEGTLLNQGAVIKEIDSAIDRPPLDLTVAVNKYEIANNIFSPSGMNKIFTIPLEKQFKTIEIEDNY